MKSRPPLVSSAAVVAAGARHRLPSVGFRTVRDQRFGPVQLDRTVVALARGSAPPDGAFG